MDFFERGLYKIDKQTHQQEPQELKQEQQELKKDADTTAGGSAYSRRSSPGAVWAPANSPGAVPTPADPAKAGFAGQGQNNQ